MCVFCVLVLCVCCVRVWYMSQWVCCVRVFMYERCVCVCVQMYVCASVTVGVLCVLYVARVVRVLMVCGVVFGVSGCVECMCVCAELCLRRPPPSFSRLAPTLAITARHT